jgi:hypothetical protein
MFGLRFQPTVDVGQFLTFLTLVGGFLWWLYTSIRGWRQKAAEDARSGALRLILKILRNDAKGPMALKALFDQGDPMSVQPYRSI